MGNTIIRVFAVALTVLMSGCATLGGNYETVSIIPEDKAVVYIYRPSRFVGSAIKPKVYAGDKLITQLVSGGYYPYFVSPGRVELWAKTEAKSSVEFLAEPGKTYFVKGTIGMGILVGRPKLEMMSADIAREEITDCKRVPEVEGKQAMQTLQNRPARI